MSDVLWAIPDPENEYLLAMIEHGLAVPMTTEGEALYRIDPEAPSTNGTLAVVCLDEGEGYTHVGVLVPV